MARKCGCGGKRCRRKAGMPCPALAAKEKVAKDRAARLDKKEYIRTYESKRDPILSRAYPGSYGSKQ